ncbi:MAG: DUF6046 domain-containing protein [Nitrosopumilus sp.]
MAIINIKNQIPKSFEDISFEESIGVSQLGTLLFDDITFPAGSYKTLEGIVVEYEKLQLQSVLMIVGQTKNIVKTQISGRNGTVKEYNNDGDYEIALQANINELENVFPAEQIQAFVEIKKVPQEIPILSKILNSFFEIDNVVIEEFSLNPQTGKGNVILEIKLTSDLPFDVKDFEV